MNNFREWLSDNLRYIMLGAAIIAILLVMFFGIRFLSSKFGGTQTNDKDVTAEKQNEEDTADDAADGTAGNAGDEAAAQEPAQEAVADNPLEKNAYPSVNALMQNYYTALGNRDVQSLKTFVDQLDPTEESAIANSQYIEGYSAVEAYTKKGLTDGSYIVFVCYGHKYVGYDTVLPGVSCMYVETKEDGSMYIVAEPTQEQQDSMSQAMTESDAQELLTAKQKEYDDTLASDAALSTYLTELGVEGSAAMEADNGALITAKSNCNVRKEASADSDKVGELVAGQQVTKTGEEGDWIKIEFDGQEGYVRGDLFQ